MSRGSSGRIVIEVSPDIKNRLYVVLAKDGLTLKDWFLAQAESYLSPPLQIPMEFSQSSANVGIEPSHST